MGKDPVATSRKPSRRRTGSAGRAPARRRSGSAARPSRGRPESPARTPLRAEFIQVGREILRGEATPSVVPRLAATLSRRGGIVHRVTVVDDTERAIASALREALERGTPLVVLVGGLGPAPDDRTLAAVAEALQRPLSESAAARRMVEAAYQRLHARGLVAKAGMTAGRAKMCRIPVGAQVLDNPEGIAPGVLIRFPAGSAVLCVPGGEPEALAVMEQALEALRDIFPRKVVVAREVSAPTADESALRPVLEKLSSEHPQVWVHSYAPDARDPDARIQVRLEAAGRTRKEAELTVEAALRRLLDLCVGL